MKTQSPPGSLPSGSATLSPSRRFHRDDDPLWHWLEDRDRPEVKAFLEAANAESDAWMAPLEPLVERLYQGHLARRELAVEGLRTALDRYVYWSDTAADADHPVWRRHPIGAEHKVEVILDLQSLSQRQSYVELGDIALSPDEQWLAWTIDAQGDEYFELYLRHLPAGEPVRIAQGIGAELVWAEDDRTLLFTRFDATQRPATVWRLDREAGKEQLVFEEPDVEFWVGLGKTRSRRWLIIETASKDTSESHLLPADRPGASLLCPRERESGVEYSLEHRPGTFYVLHNRVSSHFQLDIAAELTPGDWQPWIAPREETTLEGVDAFSWGVVLTERDHQEAQVHLRVIDLAAGDPATSLRSALEGHAPEQIRLDDWVTLAETPSSLSLEDVPDFDARVLRLREESFVTPPRWVALDLDSTERTLLKQQRVHGDLRPEQLVCRRLWATSFDGERVPVSVVMRRDLAERGERLPTLLYGYGAYGTVLDPWFSISRLELLDRGIAFAVAHVRGGGDRGEPWYLAGKLEHKQNSFRDFLAARNALVEAGISDPERIAAYGASAGGLLVGASLNLDPQAFCAAILDVPFVDVLRTMENPDLPLTTAEYLEWGNPFDPDVRRRLQAYSPLDNLDALPYPPMLLQGSWHDSRVPYWEPAKLYARLSAFGTARGPVLLRTDMTAGHGGASGRFDAWRDSARQDAFLLWAFGLADAEPLPPPADA